MEILDKDLCVIKRTVNSFINEQVISAEQTQSGYVSDLSEDTACTLKEKAKAVGLKALGEKKDWGGAELSLLDRTVIYEEASKHRLGLFHPAGDAFGEELPKFLAHCTRYQVDSFVKPAVERGQGCFLAIWEEKEDNYLENLTGTAIKSGDEWVINAHKSYIQKIENANFGVILVNCFEEKGLAKPTLFIVDMKDSFEKKESLLIDVIKTHDLFFHDVHIHDSRRIGEVGEGIELMKEWLTDSQILLGARCLGISTKALQYAQDYARLRITRGTPLADFPSIRTMIAEGIINIKVARLMIQDAAKKVDNKENDAEIAAKLAKLTATEVASKIIDDTLQIHGGAGFAGDIPIERWYKEIRYARLFLQKKETILEEIASLNL